MRRNGNLVSPTNGTARRRGAALMIVMVVVAVATVLGFAMVSASALQSQTAGNLKYVSTAEYLADSGAQLGLYYLQYPSASPVAMPDGYYPGQTGVTFGSGVAGSADISVTYDAVAGRYTITSIGRASTPGGTTVNKTVTAVCALVREFRQNVAVSTSANIRLSGRTSVIGGIETNGLLTAPTGSSVTTMARYRTLSLSGGSIPLGIRTPLTGSEVVTVPSLATIKDYTGSYTYQGVTYQAQKLTDPNLSNQTLPTASDAVTNPAGVYWSDQNVKVSGNVIFNGTLIITNGKLTVNNPLSILVNNTFTPKPGFPAIVVQSDIDVTGLLTNFTVNGLVWTGGGLKTGALTSNTYVNGAYVSAGSVPIDTGYAGKIIFTYDSSKCSVPDFSTTNTVIVGVRVVSWTSS